MKKSVFFLCILWSVLHIILVIYANRGLFFSRFDAVYWKDKYDHSQWRLPLSTRTIGDDGLYLYEGYRLIHGGDPTLLNAEVPPLGKYIMGASIILFGNGHIYGLMLTLASIIVFFILGRKYLGKTGAMIATILLLTDPLITRQFALTMLESLQLFLFLLVLSSFHLIASRKIHPILASGIAGVLLGLFSEAKVAVHTPLLLGIGILVIWKYSRHRIFSLGVFITMTVIGYLLPYIPYFLQGHTVLEWLRTQKWIVSFYAHSKLAPNKGSIFTTLLTGRFQNLFTHSWEQSPEWSPTWPLITLLAGVVITRLKNQRTLMWVFLALCILWLFAVHALIPFWTRYLVILLPLLYLASTALLLRIRRPLILTAVILALLGANWGASLGILFPTPESTVKQFVYNWKNGFFHDIYEELTVATKLPIERKAFHRFGQQTLYDGEIEAITIDPIHASWNRWSSPQRVSLRITYHTRHLGPFTHKAKLSVIKEEGRWRIPWTWDLLLPGLDPDKRLETTVIQARRGSIIASNKRRLAEDIPSAMVWVTPGKVDTAREEDMLQFFQRIFGEHIAGALYHQRYTGNNQSDWPIPIGVISYGVDPELEKKLTGFPGVQLTPHLGRQTGVSNLVSIGKTANTNFFECCSLLYTTTNYDGTQGLEKEKNEILKGYNGGTLVMKDKDDTIIRTLLTVEKKDGQDVQL